MMTLHLVIYLFCLMKDLFILTWFLSFHICGRNMCDLKKSLQLLMFHHPCLPNYYLTIIGNIKPTSQGLYQACTEATRVSLLTNPSRRNRTNQRKQAPYTRKCFRTMVRRDSLNTYQLQELRGHSTFIARTMLCQEQRTEFVNSSLPGQGLEARRLSEIWIPFQQEVWDDQEIMKNATLGQLFAWFLIRLRR